MKNYSKLIGILIFGFILTRVDLQKLLFILSTVNIPLVLIVISLNLLTIFIKSYRWNRLLRAQSIHYGLVETFLIYLSSIYIGIITPGRVGEFVKIIYLKQDHRLAFSRGITSVLIDRLFDLYFLILLGIFGLWSLEVLGGMATFFLPLIIVLLASPLIVLNKRITAKVLRLSYRYVLARKISDRVEGTFEDFYSGIDQLLSRRLIYGWFLTCLGYLVFFGQCALLAKAMGLPLGFITISIVMAVSNLVSFIPISISGLGTRDATLIYLFSRLDLGAEQAVTYAFLVFFTFFVCGGLKGAIALWIKPLKGSLKNKLAETS